MKQYTPFAPVFQVVRKSKGFAARLFRFAPADRLTEDRFQSVCIAFSRIGKIYFMMPAGIGKIKLIPVLLRVFVHDLKRFRFAVVSSNMHALYAFPLVIRKKPDVRKC